MADLNALIAQGAQFRVPPPVDPMGNMPQLMQMQSMQQQNQLNQMTMQEKQRGQQEMNALRGLMSSPDFDLSTPASQRKVYEVAPTQAESILKGYYGNLKTGAEVRNLGFTGQETQAKLALEKQKHLGQMYRDISSRPSDANITAHAEDVEASPMYTPEEKTAVRTKAERLLAMPMADRMTMLSQQGATAGELRPQVVAPGASLMSGSTVVGTAPKEAPTYAPSADQQNYDVSKAQGYKGTFLDYKKELALASRTPAQPRAESAPVPVIDPATGKQIFVSRERAIAESMTPAAAQESLAPKEIQQREAKYPQATSAIKTFESKTDSLVTDLEKLANHPGLSGISGLIYGRTLAVTKEARAAQALYDSIVARGGFAELQAMRASSPTGGALGNVSNQEGQYLRDAFAPINRTQDTGDLKRALTDAANVARASKQRVRDAYDMTYEYKAGGAPSSQAKPAAAAIPPDAIAALKAGAGTDAQFDEMFGAGAAKRARGGK